MSAPSSNSPRPVRIGTRGSPLALAQARTVRRALAAAHDWPAEGEDSPIEIVTIKTTGDAVRDRPLSDIGGKGLFTKEIEDALLAGDIDLAVHSMKDMPTVLPAGLGFASVMRREDPRDVLISRHGGGIEGLPEGAVVGSTSLRRRAQLLRLRPDLTVVTYRGNVETRLRKLAEGEVDATLLAQAGLNRLGLAPEGAEMLETDVMLPAVAQGAVCLEIREADDRARDLLAPLHDETTGIQVAAERALLTVLDGSCRTPIAGYATVSGDAVQVTGMLLSEDGRQCVTAQRRGPVSDAAALGRDAGEEIRAKAPAGLLPGPQPAPAPSA